MKPKKIEKIDNPIGISLDILKEETTVFTPNEDTSHPKPEQLLLREALKTLEPRQLRIWEMWNYDRMTQDEIAKRLKMTRDNVKYHIHRIEKQLEKWVKSNMGAYNLLKTELNEEAKDNENLR